MRDIDQFREALVRAYESVENDTMPLPKARELANIAGKIIKTISLQIIYADALKNTPSIEFLDAGPKMIESSEVQEGVIESES